MQKIALPTGCLIVDEYSKGKLETLSIGDYGKEHNIKADFLGFDREINGVPNISNKPLSEKWVMTLSTQFGCSMKCTFCDVPNVKFKGNVSEYDLIKQFTNARNCFPNVKYTDRLNLHFARMGEPSFNFEQIIAFTKRYLNDKIRIQNDLDLRIETLHPVFTTMLPKMFSIERMSDMLMLWTKSIKNKLFNGQAGLQLSINSTNDDQRSKMFNGKAFSLEQISKIVSNLDNPVGRKYCLNFAYATDFEIDGSKLSKLFDPNKWMCKITPIHNNNACRNNNIVTQDGYNHYYPYKKVENNLKEYGFDVLVFIPSLDEEDSCITCGNAILGGSTLKTKRETYDHQTNT